VGPRPRQERHANDRGQSGTQKRCASRLRQRPTAGRLHHARRFQRSRSRVAQRQQPAERALLPRPEGHGNRQVTRASPRTRALLHGGRFGRCSSPRRRRGHARAVRIPSPLRLRAGSAPMSDQWGKRCRPCIPSRTGTTPFQDDAAFAPVSSPPAHVRTPGPNALVPCPERRNPDPAQCADRGLHGDGRPEPWARHRALAKTPTLPQHAHGRPDAGLELFCEFHRKGPPENRRS
jgi:hypothetical protein